MQGSGLKGSYEVLSLSPGCIWDELGQKKRMRVKSAQTVKPLGRKALAPNTRALPRASEFLFKVSKNLLQAARRNIKAVSPVVIKICRREPGDLPGP